MGIRLMVMGVMPCVHLNFRVFVVMESWIWVRGVMMGIV